MMHSVHLKSKSTDKRRTHFNSLRKISWTASFDQFGIFMIWFE